MKDETNKDIELALNLFKKAEYEKAVAYAKEIGFTESDESELQTWVSQDDGSYEIYAGDSFSETGKIYEAERA